MNKLKAFWNKHNLKILLGMWFYFTVLFESMESAVIFAAVIVAVGLLIMGEKIAPRYIATCSDSSEAPCPDKVEPKAED